MRVRTVLARALLALMAVPAQILVAQTVWWDIDTTNKAGSGGAAPSGTWSSTRADWNPNFDGTGIPTTWTPGSWAIFSAGSDATGSYTVTVSGTQSLSGLTVEEGTVSQNGGTLDFGAETASIYTSSGATYAQDINSVFAGTGGIIKNGPGTLVLRGANTFSHSGSGAQPYLTINAGVVDFTGGVNLGALPSSADGVAVTINGGTLRFTGSSTTLAANRGIFIGASGATIETTTGLLALPASAPAGAALNGPGTITKTGNGRFELQTAQTTFTGKYIVKRGSIAMTSEGALGALPTATQPDYFTLDGGGIYGDNSTGLTLDARRGITLGAGGGFLAFNGTGLTYNGVISGNAGGGLRITVDDALSANGAGTLSLGAASSYNGPTQIDTNATLVAGILANGGVASSIGSSSSAAGNLIFNGGTLRYTGAAVNTDRNFTLTPLGGMIEASGAVGAPLKFTSTAATGVSGTGPRILVLRGTSTADNTMSLAIVGQGANATTLSKTDAGTWLLTNTANSYTGNTVISGGGRLKVGAAGVIPDASLVQLFSSSVFDLNGFDETIRSVSGTSGTLALGAKVLTIDNPNAESYSGSITGVGGGKIIKNGSGKFTLSPTTATYDGGLTLNAGSLGIGTNVALGTGKLTINNSATLSDATATAIALTNAVALNGNLTFDDSFNATPGATTWGTSGMNQWTITGASRTITVNTASGGYPVTINQKIGEDSPGRGLTKSGNGILTITAPGTYTGDTKVVAGKMSIANAYLADSADVYLSSGAILDLQFSAATPDVVDALFINGVAQATGTWGAIGSAAAHTTALINGSGMLNVRPYVVPIAGDFNGNGVVDAADYNTWRAGLGMTYTQADYDVWRTHFGQTASTGSTVISNTAVPEPTMAWMVLGGTMVWCSRRRATGLYTLRFVTVRYNPLS